ncbi:MAG: hypothetical protein NT165_01260 [Candidatus Falkowbacteria bacterium]|nr:hypothetical protein [Candidatus Falkowbacteria bacterium]
MFKKNPLFAFLAAAGEVIFIIIYFPFWWYSIGFVRCLRYLGRFLRERQESLALFVWLKNIFRPMYGQKDFTGRLISFLMRVIQIIFRALVLIIFLLLALLLALFWLAVPLLVLALIILQLL